METANNYFAQLVRATGMAWNRFWFGASSVATVSVLRIFVGIAAFYYVFSYTLELTTWFGQSGLLPVTTVEELTTGLRWSYLNLIDVPALLWAVHLVGILAITAFTIGFRTRIASVLSLIVVLSYIHRAPMLAGQFESVLSMMMLYLCLAPCGQAYSLDRFLSQRRDGPIATPPPSMAATVSVRLMQVHLALLYLMMGFTKLAGDTWWTGDAVWWLIARTESRLVDFTFLHDSIYVINAWTHAIVLFELAFAVLIWNRLMRPLLLVISVLMWCSLALITGMVAFCLMMLIANLSFVAPETFEKLLAKPQVT